MKNNVVEVLFLMTVPFSTTRYRDLKAEATLNSKFEKDNNGLIQ